MATEVTIGGAVFELDREEGTIEIKDYMTLRFTPAQLAFVLQQYGDFKVKVGDLSHWRILEGTTDAGEV
jgi:hypothetical protein